MEKIKNDTFKKFKNNTLNISEVYGGLGTYTTEIGTSSLSSTYLFWSDTESDVRYATDSTGTGGGGGDHNSSRSR